MKMKTYIWISLAGVLFTTKIVALTPVEASAADGQWKGAMYGVWVRSPTHLRAVQWNPEKQEAPLSVRAAITVARGALKKIVGDAHVHFDCEEVKIRTGPTDDWYYVVTFSSQHPSLATAVEGGISPAIFPF